MKLNKDGSLAYTLVSPEDTQPFGLYHYDGSVRVVNASSDGGFGVYSNNGALRVDFTLTNKLYNPTGALSFSVLSGAADFVTGRDVILVADGQSNGTGRDPTFDAADVPLVGLRQYVGDLGPELLTEAMANCTTTTGWSTAGCSLSVATGKLVATVTSGSNPRFYVALSGLTAGAAYLVRARAFKPSGTTINLRVDGPQTQRGVNVEPTDYAFKFVPSGTTTTLYMISQTTSPPAGAEFGVEYISVRRLLEPGVGSYLDLPATTPLAFPEALAGFGNPTPIAGHPSIGSTSPAYVVARDLLARGAKKVLVLPGAVGSTRLVSGAADWGLSGALYQQSIARLTEAMAQTPNAVPILLISQGESDATDLVSTADYKAALSAWIAGVREVGGPAMRVVIASMVPDWVTASGAKAVAIQTAQQEVAAETPHVHFVFGPEGQSRDGALHYNRAGLLTLGASMAAALR